MSFQRHTEIYQSDEVKKRRVPPLGSTLAHRLDESPSRLFLGRLLSSRACLRFTGRRYCATMDQPWQRLSCQVQNPSLTRGLTPGAHPKLSLGSQRAKAPFATCVILKVVCIAS